MLIRELFTKPIDRPINGVIKADQDDAASVWQELDEYVITKELDIHFRKFFGAYLDAIDRPGDVNVIGLVGIWISGFFGSGKSHFLKILSYLLENRAVTWNGQTQRAIAFFDGKIQDAMLAGDIKRAVGTDVDVILYARAKFEVPNARKLGSKKVRAWRKRISPCAMGYPPQRVQ